MSKKNEGELEIPLRVRVTGPPPGVLFCVQGKLGQWLSPTRSTGADLVFDVTVRASADDPPRLLGPVVQGPPAQRFLYVNSGAQAGEMSTPWSRRAKVPLTGITRALIERGKPNQRLNATIHGRMKDGGPVCATVKPFTGWRWSE